MTAVAEFAEVDFRRDGLTIHNADLPFNEWKALGEQLLNTTDRALWSLGDWWVYGERYAKDYHEALAALAAKSKLIAPAARAAKAFPQDRRRQLTFEMHEAVATLPEAEAEAWLDEAERQGWNRPELTGAFVEGLDETPKKALSVKLLDNWYDLAVSAATRREMDPREWVLEAIREKHDREMGES